MLELTREYQTGGQASEEQREKALKLMADIEKLMAETKFITDLINSPNTALRISRKHSKAMRFLINSMLRYSSK